MQMRSDFELLTVHNSDTTLYARIGEEDATNGPSDWLAGINIADFQGSTPAARLARAAASIKAVSSLRIRDLLFI